MRLLKITKRHIRKKKICQESCKPSLHLMVFLRDTSKGSNFPIFYYNYSIFQK